MPEWNDLFKEERFRWKEPREEVVAFAQDLKRRGATRVLDLGCGAGRHVVYLAREGLNVCGTDISPRGLEYTRAWLEQEGLHADLQLSDMTAIAYPDAHFDAIVSTNVIHHNTLDNRRRCVADMYRVLVPGGRALLTVPSKRSHRYRKGREVEPDTFSPSDGPEADILHHFFDEASLRLLCASFALLALTRDERYRVIDGVHQVNGDWEVTLERPTWVT